MTLVITGKGFWKQSPWGQWANEQKRDHGVDVQCVHTYLNDPQVECKCNYKGCLTVDETQEPWGKGTCPSCLRPYLIHFEGAKTGGGA